MAATARELAVLPLYLTNISVAFSAFRLFENLNLHFPAGRCTCILGASGCGKSTLLKMIAGSFPLLYSGTISVVEGARTGEEEKSSVASFCALMGQNDLLLPWFSALDNVLLGARLRGEINKETRRQAYRLLEATGLADSCSALPDSLSGGMRQRIALARTLMEYRPIMLMDEPFSALDALTRRKMQDLTLQLTCGRTVLLVTHDPLEALRLADRILVLGDSPSRLIHSVEPQGKRPRKVTDPVVQQLYPELSAILLKERDGSL